MRWLWLTWTSIGDCCLGNTQRKGMQVTVGTLKGSAAGAGAGDSPSGHLRGGYFSPRRVKQHIRSVRQQYPWSGLKGQSNWEQAPGCWRRRWTRAVGIKETGESTSPDSGRCRPLFLQVLPSPTDSKGRDTNASNDPQLPVVKLKNLAQLAKLCNNEISFALVLTCFRF